MQLSLFWFYDNLLEGIQTIVPGVTLNTQKCKGDRDKYGMQILNKSKYVIIRLILT